MHGGALCAQRQGHLGAARHAAPTARAPRQPLRSPARSPGVPGAAGPATSRPAHPSGSSQSGRSRECRSVGTSTEESSSPSRPTSRSGTRSAGTSVFSSADRLLHFQRHLSPRLSEGTRAGVGGCSGGGGCDQVTRRATARQPSSRLPQRAERGHKTHSARKLPAVRLLRARVTRSSTGSLRAGCDPGWQQRAHSTAPRSCRTATAAARGRRPANASGRAAALFDTTPTQQAFELGLLGLP